ncbi:17464_t:CDS:2, partial [Gigaspora rosea]
KIKYDTMPPKKSSSLKRKPKNVKKKVDVTLVESDISEHSNDLPKSKKTRKPNQTKDKENIDQDLETNEFDNLQSKTRTNFRSPFIESQSQHTYAEDLQNQTSRVRESPNHRGSESSPFTANKYQHKVPPQMNERSTIPRVQSGVDPLPDQHNNYGKSSSNQRNEPGIDHLLDQPNNYSKRSSNQRNEPGIDRLLDQPNNYGKRSSNQSYYLNSDEDESSEDEIFSSIGQHYIANSFKKSSHQASSLNTNSYPAIQSGLTISSTKSG